MRVCLFTNTFAPHVGGVARSVQTFLEDYRRLGHRVLVVAPEFAEGRAPWRIERSVERVAAMQNFNGSDFSVRLPLAAALSDRLASFRADLVHAHHPFLLGDTALREAARRGVPVVFTHHTLYEQYTHYVPFDSPRLKEFVITLSTLFANRCQGVIAPSESIAELIAARGVEVPIRVVPTGIDTAELARGKRSRGRSRHRLPGDAPVLGHVGRLAPEKNLELLAHAAAGALRAQPAARFLVVGDGPSRGAMERIFTGAGVAERVVFAGKLTGRALHDAYAAMDVFAFTSQSETQGMVLAEAMAAGVPVVALDASGVREIARDGENGRMLPADTSADALAAALAAAVGPAQAEALARWREGARATAARFDRSVCAQAALEFYREVIDTWRGGAAEDRDFPAWDAWLDRMAVEAQLMADKISAAVHALSMDLPEEEAEQPEPEGAPKPAHAGKSAAGEHADTLARRKAEAEPAAANF